MSEKNQVVVVMIVTLLLGAFLDRPTALKMVAGAVLLWSLQNQTTIWNSIGKLFAKLRRAPFIIAYRGDATRPRVAALKRWAAQASTRPYRKGRCP